MQYSLKSTLQSSCENGIDSFEMSVDLLKACDSACHNIISAALLKIGPSPKCLEWTEKSHRDFNAVLDLAKDKISINNRCGARQGDNLAPTLFILVLQLAAEHTLMRLKEDGIDMPPIKLDSAPTGVSNCMIRGGGQR